MRDRAVMTLLYGSGSRSAHPYGRMAWTWLANGTICALGKGGHERMPPLNPTVARLLQQYRQVRGSMGRPLSVKYALIEPTICGRLLP